MDHKKKKRSKIEDWIHPAVDILKFYVDGLVLGKPGPTRTRGVLRDSNGKVLCLFSFFMGILDSNTMELWAIKRATELALSNPNMRDRKILVVSDSKMAIAWVNHGDFWNIAQVQTIYEICDMFKSVGCIKVVFNSRIYNFFANSLVKMGSSSYTDFVDWGDASVGCVRGFVLLFLLVLVEALFFWLFEVCALGRFCSCFLPVALLVCCCSLASLVRLINYLFKYIYTYIYIYNLKACQFYFF